MHVLFFHFSAEKNKEFKYFKLNNNFSIIQEKQDNNEEEIPISCLDYNFKNKIEANIPDYFMFFNVKFNDLIILYNFEYNFSDYYFIILYENKENAKTDIIKLIKIWREQNRELLIKLINHFNIEIDEIVEYLV
jgi:hypothetical protein